MKNQRLNTILIALCFICISWNTTTAQERIVQIKDINPLGSSGPTQFTPVTAPENAFYFAATDNINGKELWKSDGTEAGTVLIKNINAGPNSSLLTGLTKFGSDQVVFTAGNGVNGIELWKTNGTASGTVMIKDLTPGSSGTSFNYNWSVRNFGGSATLYFGASGKLWKSDGTTAGTAVLNSNTNWTTPTAVCQGHYNILGNTVIYNGYDGTGTEPWQTGGGNAGSRLRDIYPGSSWSWGGTYPNSSFAGPLVNVNGYVYFSAQEAGGRRLWKTNGTTTNTVRVSNTALDPSYITPMNGINDMNADIRFSARTSAYGTELWKTDGTSAGTVMTKDIRPGSGSSFPQQFLNVNGMLYFSADDGNNGRELWKSDGTAAGTVMVKDIAAGPGSSTPTYLTELDGMVYFVANDGSGNDIWKSDGTSAGTVIVDDQPQINFNPTGLTAFNDYIVFAANGADGIELYRTVTINSWTGTTSTDWDEPTNWSTGTVPTSTDEAVIPTTPSGGNMPTVNVSGAQVNAITIETGATLTISSGNALTVGGTLTNNGTVTVQNSGSLVQATGSTLAGSGTYNVERIGATGQRFNFWSSPITSQSGVPGTSYSYDSNASTQDDTDDSPSDPGWNSYNGAMVPGVGYAGNGGGLATFNGTVNNGDVDVPLVFHAFDNTYSQTTPGTPFNLVGNPYPSAISAADLINDNASIDGTIYFWDDDLSGGTDYHRTDFAYWNGTGGLGTGGGSVGAPNGFISTAQGFYVRALNAGTLTFNNDQRVTGSNGQFFKPNAADSRLWFSIETDSLFNQVLIGALEDATEDEDRLYDAVKLRSANGISLSAIGNNVEHAIMAFPPPAANRTIPLRVSTEANGTHSFKAQTIENFEEFAVYLDDVQTGNSYQLEEGLAIPINLTAGEYTNRFFLNFVRTSFTGIEDAEESMLQAYAANGFLHVGCNSCAPNASIDLLDMSGRLVLTDANPQFNGGMSVTDISALSTGVYVVRVTTDNQVLSQKIINQ